MSSKSSSFPNWQRLKNGDLDWNIVQLRHNILNGIRDFFISRNFLEIEAPQLTPYPTLDSNIVSIPVHLEAEKKSRLYLHTSPEHSLKKCLAAGGERLFFLGKVFRNEELTKLHNPEFTMVEWYRTDSNYNDIMQDTEDLILFLLDRLNLSTNKTKYHGNELTWLPPWPRITLSDLFEERTGCALEDILKEGSIQALAKKLNIQTDDEDDWESIFFKIFLTHVETNLGFPGPVFLTDYPDFFALMAKRKEKQPNIVERCELYIAGLELANGYSELTDAGEQKERFLAEQLRKQEQGYDYRIDSELLDALNSGVPPCAGISLGVDRLMMILLDKTNIDDVLLFPYSQMRT